MAAPMALHGSAPASPQPQLLQSSHHPPPHPPPHPPAHAPPHAPPPAPPPFPPYLGQGPAGPPKACDWHPSNGQAEFVRGTDDFCSSLCSKSADAKENMSQSNGTPLGHLSQLSRWVEVKQHVTKELVFILKESCLLPSNLRKLSSVAQ